MQIISPKLSISVFNAELLRKLFKKRIVLAWKLAITTRLLLPWPPFKAATKTAVNQSELSQNKPVTLEILSWGGGGMECTTNTELLSMRWRHDMKWSAGQYEVQYTTWSDLQDNMRYSTRHEVNCRTIWGTVHDTKWTAWQYEVQCTTWTVVY